MKKLTSWVSWPWGWGDPKWEVGQSIVSQVFTVLTSDDTTGSDPPLPPVFQTYAKQLSGDSRDHEVTSCPDRTPAPAPALQSSKGSLFSLHHKSRSQVQMVPKIHSKFRTIGKINIEHSQLTWLTRQIKYVLSLRRREALESSTLQVLEFCPSLERRFTWFITIFSHVKGFSWCFSC